MSRYAQEEQVTGETSETILHTRGDTEAFGVGVYAIDAADGLLELHGVEATLKLDRQLCVELDADAFGIVALNEHLAACGRRCG